ncbi:epoxide hydrolase [Frigoribacterium sp. ACAM 257]|uniref:alpha/beta fold hydrolase n=1 Tax=Frigoribacterium sp. ACAM 257 TaxID=2508998 RepID=UPI0011BA32EA|nr:alpha/beta fold hydrolase [Frigoribacterium sp. ACAM 257]TWX38472.1 epoxide hydrolase [Frigoribacterium sp. ACAM 257]
MQTNTQSAAPARVSEEAVADLRDRLARRRRVDLPAGLEPRHGVDASWLERLLARWADGYDWRVHEQRILDLPWELVDGPTPLRVVHRRGAPGAPVVVLLHGWPDSVLRFEKVLPLLGDATVVVPALPGYPFSASSAARGMSGVDMADVVAAALAAMGHERYVVSGGDIGAGVAEALLRRHGHAVSAVHLTDVPQGHLAAELPDDLTDAERAYADRREQWQAAEGGYAHEHATKPGTLAVGLGDSPAGLLAWIGEKLWSWSDRSIEGGMEAVFGDDDVLTWVSAYWFTETIGTSFAPYALREPASNERVEAAAPAVLSIFPGDLANAPRSFAERLFDVRAFHEHPSGGHFAAWEQSEAFTADLREAITLGSARA